MRISDWSSDVCSSDLWIEAGRLLLNEQPQTRTRHPVVAGDRIELDAEPERDETIEPQDIPIDVVHLDKSIAIINKPPGLTVHPGAGHSATTLQNAVLYHFPPNAAVPWAVRVHHLAKDTSTLI